MKTDIETRRIISIVTGLTFLLVSVTGALLFFHVKSGPLVDLHEWIGILFLITAVWHLAINWRSFTSYLNNRAFWVGALGVALVCALIISMPGEHGRGRHGGNHATYSTIIQR
jgi:CDP-diglyceride synthetase